MNFQETKIEGVFIVTLQPISDDRGFFSRTFCSEEFLAHGIKPTTSQSNMSHCEKAGTLRGFHYQLPPHGETKYIRCTKGRILDIAIDLRKDSNTYLQYVAEELNETNKNGMIIPAHCAHAYLSMTDHVDVHYSTSQPYAPGSEKGIRFDDPKIAIAWPVPVTEVSEKDRSWPLVEESAPVIY